MRKSLLLIIIIAALLTGCRGASATQEQFSTTPVSSSQGVTPPAQTAEPVAQASPPGCTVISPPPTPGPTSQSLFPPVSASDWVVGPESATLTFIEYSDFQ